MTPRGRTTGNVSQEMSIRLNRIAKGFEQIGKKRARTFRLFMFSRPHFQF
jgi:hypothetical protein